MTQTKSNLRGPTELALLSTQQNSTHTLLDTTSRDNIGLASTAPGEK